MRHERSRLREQAWEIAALLLAGAAVLALGRVLSDAPEGASLSSALGIDGSGNGPTAVLVFQLLDCAESREALLPWVEAARMASAPPARSHQGHPTHERGPGGHGPGSRPAETGPRVQGVLVGPMPREERRIDEVLHAAEMAALPTRIDTGGRLEPIVRLLGYRETPVVLVFDEEGRLAAAGPPTRLTPEGWSTAVTSPISSRRGAAP